MAETLNEHQLIQWAQCLTGMQAALTDYELAHYPQWSASQKRQLEDALSALAGAAGRIYAYSVSLVFEASDNDLLRLKQASNGLKTFLKTARQIQQVLEIVRSVAALAEAVISHDVPGIVLESDQIIQLVMNKN